MCNVLDNIQRLGICAWSSSRKVGKFRWLIPSYNERKQRLHAANLVVKTYTQVMSTSKNILIPVQISITHIIFILNVITSILYRVYQKKKFFYQKYNTITSITLTSIETSIIDAHDAQLISTTVTVMWAQYCPNMWTRCSRIIWLWKLHYGASANTYVWQIVTNSISNV